MLRTTEARDSARSQILSVAAFGIGILDWSARCRRTPRATPFQPADLPGRVDQRADRRRGRARRAARPPAAAFLGIVFVVLLFITIVIYGMWVATGVAAEKSSRVMELMISAASPRQMLAGQGRRDRRGRADPVRRDRDPGARRCSRSRTRSPRRSSVRTGSPARRSVGLTPALLLGYGVFFLLGFTLFALIYAAMGSFVSRPDDLQTLSLPLSLVAMAGYLSRVVALGGGGGAWSRSPPSCRRSARS